MMHTSAYDDIVNRLQDCGLEYKDSRIIAILANSEPLKASEIGKAVGITRMDAYNILRKLQNRGYIMSTVDKPMRFTGLPLQTILEMIILREENELERIKEHLGHIEDGNISGYPLEQSNSNEATFSVLKERQNIYSAMERLIRDSEKSIWLLLGKWGILHLAKTGAMREVINALERGVDVKIMGDVEQRNLNFFEEIHKNVAIRHTDNMSLQGCLVDSEVAIMSISVGTNPVGRGKEDSALIVESTDFLESHLNLVKTVWENSIPFNSIKKRINEGVIIDPIRLSLGSGSLYQKMKEAIVEKIEDKHPQSIGWTNAILRKRGEPLPFSTEIPTFDALGIQVSEILKPIGVRIGQEIAMQFEGVKDDKIFWNELMNLWESLGMGTLNVEGNPPTHIRVDDSNACGGSPNFGKMFCHLDEGVLEGVISERFGIQVTAIERDCTAEGKPHCNFDIVF